MQEATKRSDRSRRRARWLIASLTLSAIVAAFGATLTVIEGTIVDTQSGPLADCRVVVRVADGTAVFVSAPSDSAGRYSVDVPGGERYVPIALISSNGTRIELPASEPLVASGGRLSRDLQVTLPGAPHPRTGTRAVGGVDRLFLSFVEDPALTERQYWELQAHGAADSDAPDLRAARVVAAFRFTDFPRVEFGVRAGYAEIGGAGLSDESGAEDVELWGKLELRGGADGPWDVALGALFGLPTGDEQAGLSNDSTRAEWFVAASRALPAAVVIGHAAVAANEGGRHGDLPLTGKIAASAGLGLIVPLADRVGAVFEASYDGARFEQTDSESRILAGVSRQIGLRGKLRAALGAGLDDSSPDFEWTVGYALVF